MVTKGWRADTSIGSLNIRTRRIFYLFEFEHVKSVQMSATKTRPFSFPSLQKERKNTQFLLFSLQPKILFSSLIQITELPEQTEATESQNRSIWGRKYKLAPAHVEQNDLQPHSTSQTRLCVPIHCGTKPGQLRHLCIQFSTSLGDSERASKRMSECTCTL